MTVPLLLFLLGRETSQGNRKHGWQPIFPSLRSNDHQKRHSATHCTVKTNEDPLRDPLCWKWRTTRPCLYEDDVNEGNLKWARRLSYLGRMYEVANDSYGNLCGVQKGRGMSSCPLVAL